MSLTSIPPSTQQPTDVVSRKVYINNTVLPDQLRLVQLSVTRLFNKIASAKLVFRDGSVSEGNFALSNDDRFKPGNEIKIKLGYHQDLTTVFEGIIVKHQVKSGRNAVGMLMLEAKDKAIKLTGTRKTSYHHNKTDQDVMEQLARPLQVQLSGSMNVTHKQLVQFECSNWDFILTRAEANGMLVWTDDGKIIIHKPSTSSAPVLTATYGNNIWEFEADMDARRQVSSVTSRSWDFATQAMLRSNAPSVQFTETGNIESTQLATALATEFKLVHPANLEQQQLQAWADAYALRNKLSKAVGRVRIRGNAAVKPGNMITLAGVGNRFNGNVFVSGVLHHYDGSWYTDIQFGWKDDWFYHKEKVMEKPAAGLLPGVNGLQIGKVQSVDDSENGGQYRVKVYVVTIDPEPQGIWARVASLDAGSGHGVYFRPQVGDEVVLGFVHDDPREPIVLGYLHSRDNQRSPLPVTDGNTEYGVVTKEGQKLIFDETNKRITISVTVSGGTKSIVINNDSSAIEMKDDSGNTIKMDSRGITIESSGIVTIKGSTVKIN